MVSKTIKSPEFWSHLVINSTKYIPYVIHLLYMSIHTCVIHICMWNKIRSWSRSWLMEGVFKSVLRELIWGDISIIIPCKRTRKCPRGQGGNEGRSPEVRVSSLCFRISKKTGMARVECTSVWVAATTLFYCNHPRLYQYVILF